jgi:hypothetical protein
METANQPSKPDEVLSPQPSTAETADDEPQEITKDELFHVLQNERRRRVLTYLLDREGPFEMRSIAEQVAAWEHDTTVRQLMSDERQRVYIALYQSHLPKLDDVGLIDYEQNRGVVEPTPLLETVEPYVDPPEDEPSETDDEPETTSTPLEEEEPADEETDPADVELEEQHYYVGATGVSLLLTGAVWLHAIPSTVVSGLEVAMVVTALFALTTGVLRWHGDGAT